MVILNSWALNFYAIIRTDIILSKPVCEILAILGKDRWMAGKPFWLLINQFKANTEITCSMVIKLVTLNKFDRVHVAWDHRYCFSMYIRNRSPQNWRIRSSPAKGWAKAGQMAPPLAQSSPPGKEEQGRKESRLSEEMNLRPWAAEPPESCQEPSSSEPAA